MKTRVKSLYIRNISRIDRETNESIKEIEKMHSLEEVNIKKVDLHELKHGSILALITYSVEDLSNSD